jgi:hypothetical protein
MERAETSNEGQGQIGSSRKPFEASLVEGFERAKGRYMSLKSPVTAALDFLGGVGLVLPAITRVRPELTHPAALGCALLMVAAIIFHVSRGEGSDTPFNFVLLALCAFVFWGRRFRAPIARR